jgi:hypothetical protein
VRPAAVVPGGWTPPDSQHQFQALLQQQLQQLQQLPGLLPRLQASGVMAVELVLVLRAVWMTH